MISGKIQIQKYKKIHKCTKNVRIPHILCTSQFFTCLNFLKFFGPSYGLDVVGIGSFHLGAGEMIYGKIQIQKDKKIKKATENVRNPDILRTLPILHLFKVSQICWDFTWVGC